MELLQVILPVALFALRVNLVRARILMEPSPDAKTIQTPAEPDASLQA